MDDDSLSYLEHAHAQEAAWEALCHHCGACCGAYEDPCEHLIRNADGFCSCKVYSDRFGWHHTVMGEKFRCVPVRKKLGGSWSGDQDCGYKNIPPLSG